MHIRALRRENRKTSSHLRGRKINNGPRAAEKRKSPSSLARSSISYTRPNHRSPGVSSIRFKTAAAAAGWSFKARASAYRVYIYSRGARFTVKLCAERNTGGRFFFMFYLPKRLCRELAAAAACFQYPAASFAEPFAAGRDFARALCAVCSHARARIVCVCVCRARACSKLNGAK